MKILVVESEQEDSEIIIPLLKLPWPEADIEVCHTGENGLDIAAHDSIDLIITDLKLPDMSGFDFLRSITLYASKPIIVIKNDISEDDVIKSLHLGADECFSKPLDKLNFIVNVQAVVRRYIGAKDDNIAIGSVKLDTETHRLYLHNEEIALTRNENSVLHCLMQNCGHVTSYGRLSRAVWGDDYSISIIALRSCVQRMKKKISGAEPIINIVNERGSGFRLVVNS